MKYFPRVRSKNHSLDSLRRANKGLPALPVKSIVRFGSVTETSKVFKKASSVPIVEINTVDAVRNSSSKIKMKEAFDRAKISHAKWYKKLMSGGLVDNSGEFIEFSSIKYPIIAKKVYGSRGKGMLFIDSEESFKKALDSIKGSLYMFEEYKNYVREYRLHCTLDGCFYACRKMLKEGAEDRWYRNDSNCVWYVESNPKFDKPSNWEDIIKDCVKALKEVSLDFGAFDVRVQSSMNSEGRKRKVCEFAIIEVNSAPSFGEITERKYKEILPALILKKSKEYATNK